MPRRVVDAVLTNSKLTGIVERRLVGATMHDKLSGFQRTYARS